MIDTQNEGIPGKILLILGYTLLKLSPVFNTTQSTCSITKVTFACQIVSIAAMQCHSTFIAFLHILLLFINDQIYEVKD